jgi:TolC family type I secretion outer membrane protein
MRLRPILMAVASGAALADASTSATTLPQALAQAYETNPNLLAQRQALKAVDEEYVQARAGLGAQLSLNSEISEEKAYLENPASIFSPATTTNSHARTYTQSLSLSQPLLDGGQTRSSVLAAEADILAGREQLRGAEIQLMQQVVNAYVGVLRDRTLLDIAVQSEALLLEDKTETELRLKVHEVTRTDMAQATARLEAARINVAAARSRLQISQSTYLQLVGANPDNLDTPATLTGLPATVEQAFDIAEANSPNIRASQFTERASKARVGAERAAFLPSVSARIDYLNAPENGYDARYYEHNTTARLIVSQPLYTSGMRDSRVRSAINRNNRDRLLADDARRQTIQAVSQAWSQVTASDSMLASAKAQVQAQELAYTSVKAELKAGLRTTIEVLNAEQELEQARQAVAQAQSDQYTAQTALLAATGQLRIDVYGEGAKQYRPERNFDAIRNKSIAPWAGVVEKLNGIDRPTIKVLPAIRDPAGEVRPDFIPDAKEPVPTARPE